MILYIFYYVQIWIISDPLGQLNLPCSQRRSMICCGKWLQPTEIFFTKSALKQFWWPIV